MFLTDSRETNLILISLGVFQVGDRIFKIFLKNIYSIFTGPQQICPRVHALAVHRFRPIFKLFHGVSSDLIL